MAEAFQMAAGVDSESYISGINTTGATVVTQE
jgi:hypothetical protein